MESNDDNYGSGDDSNSVSTDTRNDRLSVNNERSTRKASNVVFVSPNELENWDLDEPKSKIRKVSRPSRKSITKSAKPSKTTKPRKRKGRPKKKKDNNPWSSDMEDESLGLENEVSDDEYFRRLEAENDETGIESSVIFNKPDDDKSELDDEEKEEEEDILIETQTSFDPNNRDLINLIKAERENCLEMDDPSKPCIEFPESSNDLNCPNDQLLNLLSIYETIIQYSTILRISPFKLEDFVAAMVVNENSVLLSEMHMTLLKYLLREDDANNTTLCPIDQKEAVNFAFYLMDFMTWPESLKQYLDCLDLSLVISECYPFVTLDERIKVLNLLIDQFILCTSVHTEISRENNLGSEDFCRVCHLSGEVLCCDTCTAVYHLDCLNPKLSEVPKTNWICQICIRHRVDGLYNCNFDADKAMVEHKKTPLGSDRFGNIYWFVGRRLIVEPRNDNVDKLADYNSRNNKENFHCDYNKVRYYSCWNAIVELRKQLNKQWEEELCSVIDGLEEEIRKTMMVTLKLTEKSMNKLAKHPKITEKNVKFVSVLKQEIERYENSQMQETNDNGKEDEKSQDTSLDEDEEDEFYYYDNSDSIQNCHSKTITGQTVGAIEDQEGLSVRNIDSNNIRVRLSAKTRSNQLDEVAARYNFNGEIKPFIDNVFYFRLSDEGNWRLYENVYTTDLEALSKSQHQEDRDKLKFLSNKFAFNDNQEFQWFVSQTSNRTRWLDDILPIKRGSLDILGGPLNMLQCLRLTLQNFEAQMFGGFMCPAWKNERRNWLINIQRTRNASNLADFVASFENNIRPCVFRQSWNTILGALKLERSTVADREEEKRLKALEKKMMKPDNDIVKTRNPGFLKHAIWKVKGEEYRRNGGDGWSWLNVSVKINNYKLNSKLDIEEIKPIVTTKVDRMVIDESEGEDEEEEKEEYDEFDLTAVDDEFDGTKSDELLYIREKKLNENSSQGSFTDIRAKLMAMNTEVNEMIANKRKLEEQVEQLVCERQEIHKKQNRFRKRTFYPGEDNLLAKRMRLNQYDGVDESEEETEHSNNNINMSNMNYSAVTSGIAISNAAMLNTSSSTVQSAPMIIQQPNLIQASAAQFNQMQRPVLLNNQQNRVCIVNASGQRFILNNPSAPNAQIAQQWNGQQLIRLTSPQFCKLLTTQQPQQIQNPQQQPQQYNQFKQQLAPGTFVQSPNQTSNPNQNIRKLAPQQQHGQQIIMLNNMPNGQLNNSFMYSVNNPNIRISSPMTTNSNITNMGQQSQQQQHPVMLQQFNHNNQQLKRILPFDSSMLQQVRPQMVLQQHPHQQQMQHSQQQQQRMMPNSNVNANINNNNVNLLAGRRSISKINHTNDIKMLSNMSTSSVSGPVITPIGYNEELEKQREIDQVMQQIVELNNKIEDRQKQLEDLRYLLRNCHGNNNQFEYNIGEVKPSLMQQYTLDEQNKVVWPLRLRNNFVASCSVEADDDNMNADETPANTTKDVQSIFFNQPKHLRSVVLAAGKIDVPGFDVEKKRINTLWSYPTARPNLSTTWCYKISEIVNFDITNTNILQNDNLKKLYLTEPLDELPTQLSSGSCNLASVALCIKMLWYSLRWSEMMHNFPEHLNELYKDNLNNNDTIERKIVGWKPMKETCEVVNYKVIICTSTSVAMLNKSIANDDANSDISSIAASSSIKTSSRRPRRSVATRYTDTDHFTDDGERDSDDSDPSFVPGMSNRTPKSRGSRRGRNRQNGDDNNGSNFSGGLVPITKMYTEKIMRDDDLELHEIRDFLYTYQWNPSFIYSTENLNYCASVRAKINKEIFEKPMNSWALSRNNAILAPLPNTNALNLVNTPTDLSGAALSSSASVSTSINTNDNAASTGVPTLLSSTGENVAQNKLIISSQTPTMISVLPSGQANNIPQPIADIREVSNSNMSFTQRLTSGLLPQTTTNPTAPNLNQSTTKSKPGRGRGRGRPPLCPAPGSNTSDELNYKQPAPILPQLNNNQPNPINIQQSLPPNITTINNANILNSQLIMPSNNLVNLIQNNQNLPTNVTTNVINPIIPEENFDKLAEEVKEASMEVHERQEALREELLEQTCVKTMDRLETIQQHQLIQQEEELKKKRSSSHKKMSTMDDDEETDAEIDTPSTSPAVTTSLDTSKNKTTSHKSVESQTRHHTNPIKSISPVRNVNLPIVESHVGNASSNKSNKSIKSHNSSKSQRKRKQPPSRKRRKHESEDDDDDDDDDEESEDAFDDSVPSDNTDQTSENSEMLATNRSAKRRRTQITNEIGKAESDEKLYCICQTPNNKKENYICCDICEIWYHFKCVNMDANKAKQLQYYKCSRCEQAESLTINNSASSHQASIASHPHHTSSSSRTTNNPVAKSKQNKSLAALAAATTASSSHRSSNMPNTSSVPLSNTPAGNAITKANTNPHNRREQISRQHDANQQPPEQDEDEEDREYCICRTKNDNTKMYIGCDFCDEWYHPTCVGLTDELANNYEGLYKCPKCLQKQAKSQMSKPPPSHQSQPQQKKYPDIDCQKKIDSHIRKKLGVLVNMVMNHRDALPLFKNFKPDDYPKYYQVVKNPMDLLTVKSNLDKSKYKNLGSFKLDVESIFVTCSTYFENNSRELISAKKLESYFHNELSNLFQ